METWEYTIESGIKTREDLVQFLNRMSVQGWEAVGVQWVPTNPLWDGAIFSRKGYYEVTLKRRTQG
jgi:hypothetical protein